MSFKNPINLIVIVSAVAALMAATVLLGGYTGSKTADTEAPVKACQGGMAGCPMTAQTASCPKMTAAQADSAGCSGKTCTEDCPKPCCAEDSEGCCDKPCPTDCEKPCCEDKPAEGCCIAVEKAGCCAAKTDAQ